MNAYISRTNQKIYFAELTLDRLQQTKNSPAALEADKESLLFHLYSAYLALLQEIAYFYQLDPQHISLSELIHRFQRKKAETYLPPEVEELRQLLDHHESWLSQLIEYFQSLMAPLPNKATSSSADAIPLLMTNADNPPPFSVEIGTNLVKQLKNLVMHIRNYIEEW